MRAATIFASTLAALVSISNAAPLTTPITQGLAIREETINICFWKSEDCGSIDPNNCRHLSSNDWVGLDGNKPISSWMVPHRDLHSNEHLYYSTNTQANVADQGSIHYAPWAEGAKKHGCQNIDKMDTGNKHVLQLSIRPEKP